MSALSNAQRALIQTGCYVDGWLGQYAGAAMILTATSFGYDDEHVVERARRHYDAMGSRAVEPLTDDEHEQLPYDVDDVERWLNENVATDGNAFGWHDGDFHYQSEQWWEDGA